MYLRCTQPTFVCCALVEMYAHLAYLIGFNAIKKSTAKKSLLMNLFAGRKKKRTAQLTHIFGDRVIRNAMENPLLNEKK